MRFRSLVFGPTRLGLAVLSWTAAACNPACTPPPADPAPTSADAASAPAASSGDAKAAAPGGGAPAQDQMIMEAKGVDLSKLSEAQRASFFQLINVEPSACDKPHSLATSLRDDAQCRDSLIVAQFAADRLAVGATVADVRLELTSVVDALKVHEIDTKGRPSMGNDRAPVTVVMFADFQCPHCKAEAPVVRETIKKYPNRVRLVFKHFPLSAHPRAKVAAIACEAALAQGKFWEMHDIVFQNNAALEDADLRRYAQEIGLDLAAFDAHFGAKKGEAAVSKDRDDGEKLGIQGTPAVYVNGRVKHPLLFGGTLEGAIEEALRR
ncbi:MAG: hypothetical protein B7733_25725 [Myxococcales bacterium FL481]|nr:MAG: hypothetical protein B7733_25725 [Myxococcales bacterium FL481]